MDKAKTQKGEVTQDRLTTELPIALDRNTMNSERKTLLATLQECERARAIARRRSEWTSYCEAVEACRQVGRRLELLEQQEKEESKL